jgi:hypothetical protein
LLLPANSIHFETLSVTFISKKSGTRLDYLRGGTEQPTSLV